jgi:Skp family chaperone for outer membrane proteins
MPRLLLALLISTILCAGDSGDAPKVAVIRLVDAINASKSYQGRIEVFKQEKAGIDAKVKEFDEQIQKLNTSLEALPAGNEKLAQIQEEQEATKARREAFVRRVTADFERRQITIIREQYQVARVLLAEFCKARGIKIVVQAASDDVGARDIMLMNLRVEMQTALYWDADQDITDAYVGFANQKFAEKTGASEGK